MTLEDFIERNRNELIKIIKNKYKNCYIDNEAIEGWIMNDESLYNWAIINGVDI